MLNLLIADDEELERRAVKNIIGKSFEGQFNIFEAKNGRQAIEAADREKPEIIIMDIKMPGIDGIEAIKEISKFLGESYFIVLSAYDYFNYAKEAMKCGVKDYVLKPLKKDELVNKIKEAAYYIEKNKNKRKEEIEIKERLKTIQPIVQNELCYAFKLKE
jgi:two-component system response regulator YesN